MEKEKSPDRQVPGQVQLPGLSLCKHFSFLFFDRVRTST